MTLLLLMHHAHLWDNKKKPRDFFQKNKPNFKNLNTDLQSKMLSKASTLIKKGYYTLHGMFFLTEETTDQINNFLKKNKNFTIK